MRRGCEPAADRCHRVYTPLHPSARHERVHVLQYVHPDRRVASECRRLVQSAALRLTFVRHLNTHCGCIRCLGFCARSWGSIVVVFFTVSTVALSHAQGAAPEPTPATKVNVVSNTSFPGSAWVNSGYISPLEPGNLLTTSAFEQGITLVKRGPHSVAPYAALTITQDSEGLDWNNKVVSQIGLKYSRVLGSGIVQAGAGYAYERRFRSSLGMGQPIGFASYWFGWNRDLRGGRPRRLWSSLPGTSWAAVGNHAPAERNNVIASVYVQQGVTLARISGCRSFRSLSTRSRSIRWVTPGTIDVFSAKV